MLVLALSMPAAAAVEITNFRSGLACTETRLSTDSAGWICHATEDVLVTDQGVCVFNGTELPCTWIGYQFDYVGASKSEKLQCESETSAPASAGNPKQLIARDANSHSYEITLDSTSGHVFNPQYFAFAVRPDGKEVLVNTGRCKSGNRIVFEYRFKLRFPTASD